MAVIINGREVVKRESLIDREDIKYYVSQVNKLNQSVFALLDLSYNSGNLT